MARKPKPLKKLQSPIAEAWAYFREGRHALAAAALNPLLDSEGDTPPALAAALLRHDLCRPEAADPGGLPVADEALSDAVQRLMDLVQRQDGQIGAAS